MPNEDSDSEDDFNTSNNGALSPSVESAGRDSKENILEISDASKYKTVPSKLDSKQLQWDELDELLQVEREWKDHIKPYQTLPTNVGNQQPV